MWVILCIMISVFQTVGTDNLEVSDTSSVSAAWLFDTFGTDNHQYSLFDRTKTSWEHLKNRQGSLTNWSDTHISPGWSVMLPEYDILQLYVYGRCIDVFITWISRVSRRSHVGRWRILHKTGPTTVLFHFSVQITFLRVPPEVETHTFWIDKTQIKAVWIALYGFWGVSRVEKSKSTLRPLYTTQAAISSWKFELKIAENCRNTDEIHKGISINIWLCSMLAVNPSSTFFFSCNVGTELSTPVSLNGDY